MFRAKKILGGVPTGMYAPLLKDLHVREKRPLIFIASEDVGMFRLRDHLNFFAPKLSVACFPAWDCLPYEWVSPRSDIRASRLTCLINQTNGSYADIILTTASAVLQFLPPPDTLKEAFLRVEQGKQTPNRLELLDFLEAKGYMRVNTVRELGEYAIRGSLIDIFPCGHHSPIRIDFFGDQIDNMRYFDPVSQLSLKKTTSAIFYQSEEILLSDENCRRFRQNYRLHNEAGCDQDSFYQAISQRHRQPGFEHWLPLFYDSCATLFDYLPENRLLVYSETAGVAFEAHHDLVSDNYHARCQDLPTNWHEIKKNIDAGLRLLKPLAPEKFYLDSAGWEKVTAKEQSILLQATASPPVSGINFEDMGGQSGADFSGLFRMGKFYPALQERIEQEKRPMLFLARSAGSRERLKAIFQENGFDFPLKSVDDIDALSKIEPPALGIGIIEAGRGFASRSLVVITEQDIFGERLGHVSKKHKKKAALLPDASCFSTGDHIVHDEHGIGLYQGFEHVTLNQTTHDCLTLLYADDAKLYVPVENMDCLSPYGKDSDRVVALDRLGHESWQNRKSAMKRKLRDIADDLVKVAAQRHGKEAPVFLPPESGAWETFCAGFSFVETEEQLEAINDVLEDLASSRVMDRLICGNAGVGKTEIALRALFLVVMAGYQAVMIVPTTLLARQHYENFKKRFDRFAVKILLLTRHTQPSEATKIRLLLSSGAPLIVVGTHALLSEKINLANPGLAVIDEEQQFGVVQKEKLKKLYSRMHLLTLSATPIPRSLQMALAGIRDLSLISQAPLDRLSIRSFVMPFDPVVIREALRREHMRGGQTFCVCPRRADMQEAEKILYALAPTLRIVTAHGKMKASAIEKAMEDFVGGKADILLSTPIVESGLDIPRANTMIILRSHIFGLAQLYQLRGRVGRSKLRGYCYFTLPPRQNLTKEGRSRLDFIREFNNEGAGFHIAYHDMDMRGSGNLLGEEQSGHIPEIGVGLYQKMLTQALEQARDKDSKKTDSARTDSAQTADIFSPLIHLGVSVMIPESYIADEGSRIEIYTRLSHCSSDEEINAIEIEMVDRFGIMPEATKNLMKTLKIRNLCKIAGIGKLEAGPQGITLHFHKQRFANPLGLAEFLGNAQENIRLRPDHSLIYSCLLPKPTDKLTHATSIAGKMAKIALAE